MNTCNIQNNCRRAFAIHKYETSTINTTAARNLSNYENVDQIVPRDGSGNVRENGSVNINFATEATGFYLGIQDETSCIVIHRVLVFYYVCPAVTSDLITHPETIAPIIGASTPVQVVGNCVASARPQSGATPYLTCSQKGVWTVNIGAGCVCNAGFQSSSDGHSCVGMLSVYLLSSLSLSPFYYASLLSVFLPDSFCFFLPTLQPVMLGHMEQVAPASLVLPTVTAHRVGSLCVPALKVTTELLGNLQKWHVLVSLVFVCLLLLLYTVSRACGDFQLCTLYFEWCQHAVQYHIQLGVGVRSLFPTLIHTYTTPM